MLQAVHSAYSEWTDAWQEEDMVPKGGESDAFMATCTAESRYHGLVDRVHRQKELLHAELSK